MKNTNKLVYSVKKIMTDTNGKRTYVLLTDGHSEILELPHKNIAENLVDMLNENSDSGWTYELMEIKPKQT